MRGLGALGGQNLAPQVAGLERRIPLPTEGLDRRPSVLDRRGLHPRPKAPLP